MSSFQSANTARRRECREVYLSALQPRRTLQLSGPQRRNDQGQVGCGHPGQKAVTNATARRQSDIGEGKDNHPPKEAVIEQGQELEGCKPKQESLEELKLQVAELELKLQNSKKQG